MTKKDLEGVDEALDLGAYVTIFMGENNLRVVRIRDGAGYDVYFAKTLKEALVQASKGFKGEGTKEFPISGSFYSDSCLDEMLKRGFLY